MFKTLPSFSWFKLVNLVFFYKKVIFRIGSRSTVNNRSKRWPLVTEDGSNIDILNYKLVVSDFKWEWNLQPTQQSHSEAPSISNGKHPRLEDMEPPEYIYTQSFQRALTVPSMNRQTDTLFMHALLIKKKQKGSSNVDQVTVQFSISNVLNAFLTPNTYAIYSKSIWLW